MKAASLTRHSPFVPERVAALGLLGLTGFAVFLRTWGLDFGLPYLYHYDEHFYVNTALKLGTGVLQNPPYAPTGFSNILFLEYAVYYVFGRLAGWFPSAAAFELAFRSDPSTLHILARLTSAALGTATVAVVYHLGRLLRDQTVGFLAAFALSIAFLHVRDSHYAVPDVAMTFFVVASVTLAMAYFQNRSRSFLYLSGMTAGLAIATKWTALPVIVPVILSVLLEPETPRPVPERLRLAVWALVAVAVGFAIGSPQILVNPAPYIAEARGQYGADSLGGFGIWSVDTVPGWLFYVKTLFLGVSPLMLLLAVVGGVLLLSTAVRGDRQAVLAFAFPLIYFLGMGATRHYFARYALPLIPFAVVFAAYAIFEAWVWLARLNRPLGSAAVAGLVLVALAWPLVASVQHDLLLTRTDTRTLAKAWIEANIPAGAKIAVDWPVHGPPLATPDLSVPGSKRTYDVTILGATGLSEHTLDWYRENGYEYLIASSFIYDINLVEGDRNEARQAFYNSLNEKLPVAQVVSPSDTALEVPFAFDEIYGPFVSLWQRERPGPTIKIFELAR